MDFGGGFATGIAVGMGSGVASGIATGRSQLRKQIRSHMDQSGVTIQDRYGKPIKLDEFLEDACGVGQGGLFEDQNVGLCCCGARRVGCACRHVFD